MSRITVVGAGAWGTALAIQAVRAGHSVVLVARTADTVAAIQENRENPRLPGTQLPDTITVIDRLPDLSELLVWVVPTQHLRSSLLKLKPGAGGIVVCPKGLKAGTHMLPLEVVGDVTGARPLAV